MSEMAYYNNGADGGTKYHKNDDEGSKLLKSSSVHHPEVAAIMEPFESRKIIPTPVEEASSVIACRIHAQRDETWRGRVPAGILGASSVLNSTRAVKRSLSRGERGGIVSNPSTFCLNRWKLPKLKMKIPIVPYRPVGNGGKILVLSQEYQ